MVKKITWTDSAELQLEEILTYWIERTKSYTYSLKISSLIYNRINWISKVNFKGTRTSHKYVSVAFISHFGVFYEFTELELVIYAIWDTRRDPENSPYEF